ncbi:MAG: hypothetical protein R3F34_13350 [Planctomycetota bacterium]
MTTTFLASFPLIALLSLAQVASVDDDAAVEPAPSAPRETVLHWTSDAGQEYLYRLPRTQDVRRKPRLVFLLHGDGEDAPRTFEALGVGDGSFRPDDVLVAPEAVSSDAEGGRRFASVAAEGAQLATLVRLFRERFDTEGVALYGHDSGGAFCCWFAGEHPELVDGSVVHGAAVGEFRSPEHARLHHSVAILHAEGDGVVEVAQALRTAALFRARGYAKVNLHIAKAHGHGALPEETDELLRWIDDTTSHDAAQALEVARDALRREQPDYATAARLVQEARVALPEYDCGDADEVEASIAVVEGALAAAADAAWTEVEYELTVNSNGESVGPYASCVRWARVQFGEVPSFAAQCRPYVEIFERHDAALRALRAGTDVSTEAGARRLVDALRGSWLASGWNALHAEALARCTHGAEPYDGFRASLESLGALCGVEPMEELVRTSNAALAAYAAENPGLYEGY